MMIPALARLVATPLRPILRQVIPPEVAREIHDDASRDRLSAAADLAVVSAYPAAGLVPAGLRRRVLRYTIDTVLDAVQREDA